MITLKLCLFLVVLQNKRIKSWPFISTTTQTTLHSKSKQALEVQKNEISREQQILLTLKDPNYPKTWITNYCQLQPFQSTDITFYDALEEFIQKHKIFSDTPEMEVALTNFMNSETHFLKYLIEKKMFNFIYDFSHEINLNGTITGDDLEMHAYDWDLFMREHTEEDINEMRDGLIERIFGDTEKENWLSVTTVGTSLAASTIQTTEAITYQIISYEDSEAYLEKRAKEKEIFGTLPDEKEGSGAVKSPGLISDHSIQTFEETYENLPLALTFEISKIDENAKNLIKSEHKPSPTTTPTITPMVEPTKYQFWETKYIQNYIDSYAENSLQWGEDLDFLDCFDRFLASHFEKRDSYEMETAIVKFLRMESYFIWVLIKGCLCDCMGRVSGPLGIRHLGIGYPVHLGIWSSGPLGIWT